MLYKVIHAFKDKENNNLFYHVGDEYPARDYKPSKKRISELTKEHPKYKYAFIEEIKEQDPKEEPPKENKE